MADHTYKRTFFLPVYKANTTTGALIEAGDTLTVLKASTTGSTHPTQDITVIAVSDGGRTVHWEYDAGNVYIHPEDIIKVHPKHQWFIPGFGNVGATDRTGSPAAPDDTAVTNFKIGAESFNGTWPITAQGAADLEAAMQEAIDNLNIVNPIDGYNKTAVTVTWVDDTTDYLQIYVLNTNQVWKVTDSDGEVTLSAAGLP